ncbi:MAG: Ig-like domain-containing protein [Roseiflexaceae bacterium]
MRRFLLLVLLGILLVACDQAATPKPVATQSAQNGATQPPVGGATQQAAGGATATGAYPAPEPAYPAPTVVQSAEAYPSPAPQGPEFTLNTPVRASDAQVTGKGPAGVPVKLISVARSGELIGETTIDANGIFTVTVATQLIAGDRIALTLGNTAGTKFDPNNFLHGPGYQDYPLVGILLSSTVVE